MECQEARELMSDYLEEYLADPEADLLEEHLSGCGECRLELDDLKKVLAVVHGLPRQEPVFDLWQDFEPTFAQVCAETKPGAAGRASRYFRHILGSIAEGWMIFTAAVHYNMGGNVTAG